MGFWRSASRFAASYKALFMHLTCDMYRTVPSLYRPSTDCLIYTHPVQGPGTMGVHLDAWKCTGQ